MNDQTIEKNRRILIVDDNRAVHADFRKIFKAAGAKEASILNTHNLLFGKSSPLAVSHDFHLDSVYQGKDAVTRVRDTAAENLRYSLAFIDVRMPPGWDGLETTAQIWAVDPDIQVVLCTAYSDSSWEDTIKKLGRSDRLLILKKPFDSIEVLQLAEALTEKWLLLQLSRIKCQALERAVFTLQESETASQWALEGELKTRRMNSYFVTTVAEELRTSLGTIGAAAELLGRCSDQMTKEARAMQIAEIDTSVRRMRHIVAEFLSTENFDPEGSCATLPGLV